MALSERFFFRFFNTKNNFFVRSKFFLFVNKIPSNWSSRFNVEIQIFLALKFPFLIMHLCFSNQFRDVIGTTDKHNSGKRGTDGVKYCELGLFWF